MELVNVGTWGRLRKGKPWQKNQPFPRIEELGVRPITPPRGIISLEKQHQRPYEPWTKQILPYKNNMCNIDSLMLSPRVFVWKWMQQDKSGFDLGLSISVFGIDNRYAAGTSWAYYMAKWKLLSDIYLFYWNNFPLINFLWLLNAVWPGFVVISLDLSRPNLLFY